jgi:hypothetical protein
MPSLENSRWMGPTSAQCSARQCSA